MATKKQNRRHQVRAFRRALKKLWDLPVNIRRGIHRKDYGGGLGRGEYDFRNNEDKK